VNIIIYARVSTTDQNVKQQINALKEHAKRNNYNIIKIVSDEESGRKELFKRKKFKKLLSELDKYDAVLIHNLDRLTRNWYDENEIEKAFSNKCKLISMSDPIDLQNASGRLMFRIKMAVSTYMPEDMLEKQKIGIDRAKKEGKFKGGTKGRTWTRKKPKRKSKRVGY
jgi:DNA invertase Pin-like site-specific DNA recombinase